VAGLLADLLVLALFSGMVIAGYQRGAIVSLYGVGCGLLGAIVFATVASAAGAGRLVALSALLGAVIGAGIGATQMERVREWVTEVLGDDSAAHQVDRALGLLGNGLIALAIAWTVGVVLDNAQSRDHGYAAVRDSHVLNLLFDVASPQGGAAATIARSGLVPALDGPVIIVEDPDAAIDSAPAVRQVEPSIVRVRGQACQEISTGTAWPIASNLLVTNAHVVAGERQTFVQLGGTGRQIPVTVVHFDPQNDIAVLAAPSLSLRPIPLDVTPTHGEAGAIVGYPRQRSLQVNPARFDRTVMYPSFDIYNKNSVPLRVAVFRGAVEPGNSGSPIVNAEGQVLMMVAADAIGQGRIGGFGVPVDVISTALAASGTRQVDTGPCLTD
jgi:hypothetical protein